jgi:hypothetical protein
METKMEMEMETEMDDGDGDGDGERDGDGDRREQKHGLPSSNTRPHGCHVIQPTDLGLQANRLDPIIALFR